MLLGSRRFSTHHFVLDRCSAAPRPLMPDVMDLMDMLATQLLQTSPVIAEPRQPPKGWRGLRPDSTVVGDAH